MGQGARKSTGGEDGGDSTIVTSEVEDAALGSLRQPGSSCESTCRVSNLGGVPARTKLPWWLGLCPHASVLGVSGYKAIPCDGEWFCIIGELPVDMWNGGWWSPLAPTSTRIGASASTSKVICGRTR